MRMSQRLEKLRVDASTQGSVSVQELVDQLGTRSHGIAVLLLSVPFIQPIPMLGLSTVFGMIIITISIAYALGKPPYIPSRFRDHEVPTQLLVMIGEKGSRFFCWIEKYIKPRGVFFHSHGWTRSVAAILIAISGLLLALPLPIPASNTIPTIPIVLLALGLIEEDGYFILAGYLAFILAVTFFALIFIGPFAGIALMLNAQ